MVLSRPRSLQLVATGQGSPCVDLGRITDRLAALAVEADLLVLHGMGRAIHTNYHARFSVDTLKVAVVKSEVVAEHIHARLFEGVVRFEPAPPERA